MTVLDGRVIFRWSGNSHGGCSIMARIKRANCKASSSRGPNPVIYVGFAGKNAIECTGVYNQ